jgi:hypothetical protein
VLRRARPRHLLAWSAVFALAACNALWGIDDGSLADQGLAGASGADPGGGAPPESAGAAGRASAGEAGENVGGGAGNPAASGAAGEDTSGGSGTSGGGVSGGSGGSASGSGGATSGSGGGGTGPCSGCQLGETQSENQSCGRCGTGTQSRTRTCDDKCTWGAWSNWGICSQCDAKQYRCCGAGKWEWCYDSDCAWTNDCAPCVASSCPEC